jgi:hypothetical protein
MCLEQMQENRCLAHACAALDPEATGRKTSDDVRSAFNDVMASKGNVTRLELRGVKQSGRRAITGVPDDAPRNLGTNVGKYWNDAPAPMQNDLRKCSEVWGVLHFTNTTGLKICSVPTRCPQFP